MNLLRAATTVGSYTMASRVLGFARDVLIADRLGAGLIADAFFVAFKLPNFFRRLFAEGAFSAGFVPLFSIHLTREGKGAARAFAEEAMSILLWSLMALLVVVEVTAPWLMYGLAPGFSSEPAKFDLTVALTRLAFPYLVFVSIVSLMGGMLNALGRFAVVAAAPMLLNLCMITGLLVLNRLTETPGHALAWSVSAAGLLQMLWLAHAVHREGFGLRLPRPRITPRVRQLLALMVPGAIGAGVVQINLVVDVMLASLLPAGSVSFLYYADRVTQLPLGVIGVGVGTALLPLMSRQVAAGDLAGAIHSQNRAAELALLLTLPAMAALLVLAEPLTAVLFERGAFAAADTAATAGALVAFTLGLPAYVMVKVLAPAYFARRDTRTPVRIGLICLAVNLALNLILMWPLKHVGLALSTAIAAWLNAVLLARGLYVGGHFRVDARLKQRVLRIAGSVAAMALGLWLAERAVSEGRAGIGPVLGMIALIVLGAVLYLAAAQVSGAARWGEVRRMLRREGVAVDRTGQPR
ncbi:MAG: murein biosynthesis integral membrane protein MurJ [Alphaproteobacteria bacterium]|nr:murein biosynthesis integral membrane protein MurJ [Alphaproteobacteria bacterium]